MDFRIDALVLPKSMIWPSFLASKQSGTYFKNIYLQRQNAVDVNRRTISLDILRRRGKVVWTGSPGIGKSCDINFIFIELLSHLGEEGWPDEVLFRHGASLYTFTSSGVTHAPFTYSELEEYSRRYKYTNSILILELRESETDPVINMPFILAVSARQLKSKLKTIDQTRDTEFMLVAPPDVDEVCLMAEAVMDICPQNDEFEGKSKEDVVSMVRERALQVGAIPRYLFCTYSSFKRRLDEMKLSASTSLSFDFLELSVNNIPDVAQYLVAPYFKSHVTNPITVLNYEDAASDYFKTIAGDERDRMMHFRSVPSFEFRYLCDYALKIHIKALKNPNDIEVIKRMGFDYQLSGAIIKFGGVLIPKSDEKIDDISSSYWEWHKNIDYKATLSRKSLLPEDKIPVLPRCSAEILFAGQYYVGDVSELNPDRVYRGTFHNLALYEYFTVDHNKKMIYLYQTTTLDLNRHSFALSTVKDVMTKLGMFQNRNSKYKVTLLCFCDWSRRTTYGTKIFDTNSSNRKGHSLEYFRSVENEVAVRLEIYIIRARLLQSAPRFILK